MPIGLHNLTPASGSTHRRKRIGRGIGSGHGKTSTRGHKGNKVRGQINPNFEGGQTPLHRRLPQLRGFTPVNKKHFALVNVDTLQSSFEDGAEITPALLLQSGVLRNLYDGVKILGNGEVSKKFIVWAHKFSRSAQEKLTGAGGSGQVLNEPHEGRNRSNGNLFNQHRFDKIKDVTLDKTNTRINVKGVSDAEPKVRPELSSASNDKTNRFSDGASSFNAPVNPKEGEVNGTMAAQTALQPSEKVAELSQSSEWTSFDIRIEWMQHLQADRLGCKVILQNGSVLLEGMIYKRFFNLWWNTDSNAEEFLHSAREFYHEVANMQNEIVGDCEKMSSDKQYRDGYLYILRKNKPGMHEMDPKRWMRNDTSFLSQYFNQEPPRLLRVATTPADIWVETEAIDAEIDAEVEQETVIEPRHAGLMSHCEEETLAATMAKFLMVTCSDVEHTWSSITVCEDLMRRCIKGFSKFKGRAENAE